MKKSVFRWMRAATLGSLVMGWGCAGPEEPDSTQEVAEAAGSRTQTLTADKGDLDFILKQIQIAEAHAAGTPIQSLIPSPQLHYGLRTVDGSHNNIVPGQEEFGAADRIFPRLTTPVFRDGENVSIDLDGPGPMTVGTPTSYAQTRDFVFDSQVRIASNLIVDQSSANPAAVAAAAATAGSEANVDGRGTFYLPNVAPDVGLSAPFNSWFTFFGQFFDHGLDLVNKGGSGTVFIPLQPDDPLFVPGSPTNFMVLDRATNRPGVDGVLGTADDVHEHLNHTTAHVDQNQTYTSHPSHQVFLREYALVGGRPVSTGRLLDGARGGIANWREVKDQARNLLGIELSDADAVAVPLLATDEYGRFLPGPGGFPQLVTSAGGLLEGSLGSPVTTATARKTGHTFLEDIAHTAAPRPGLLPDADAVANGGPQPAGTYDDELLAEHFCTGDGRGNENIGLTAVHFIFHAEHNRLTGHVKDVVLATANPTYIAQWLVPGANQADGIQDEEWNGERIFQAARFGTEMQYQHLVFEEFARKVQPEVNVFAGYDLTIDPAIMAEFAHTVYRFGHTMLTETIPRTLPDGTREDIGLIEAFLNPPALTGSAATDMEAVSNIVRGTTRQIGNEVDEFVTGALRNNLLGLPLDLATINLARGRDTGVPSLNAARQLFFNATGSSALRPYSSWMDYSFSMRHPESLVNFIAAYGTHPTVTGVATLADKRAAASLLVNGGVGEPPDRIAFLTATGPWAIQETGLNTVDFWVGGLAERQMIFGGLLGSTFNFVFETQLEKLQDGDRLYYLLRNVGLNFLTQLEQNTFAELVMRNTNVKHLPADIFSRPAFIFELANLGTSGTVLDDPATPDDDESELLIRMPDGTIRYTGVEHIVMGGTPGDDRMWGSEGDDTFWGDEGNDRIEGGDGNDFLNGGDGDDILTDLFGFDNIKGGEGNDVISAGPGLGELILAGGGNDFVVAGTDPKETFGGHGNDFIIAGDGADIVFGGEGDDWIEGGDQADLLQGDNGDPFQTSPIAGNDVIMGQGGNDDFDAESGDDILVSDSGTERHEGMLGFDWVTYKGSLLPADADLDRTVFAGPDVEDLRDRFDLVEGLSGWDRDDVLIGDDATSVELLAVDPNSGFNNALNDTAQINLIDGLQGLLGGATSFAGGNIILGGAGSDRLEGRGGDDILDGDAWLNVRISVRDALGNEIGWADTMKGVLQNKSGVLAGTRSNLTLSEVMFDGLINPGQLRIVREILTTPPGSSVDTAVFSDSVASYDIARSPDGSILVTHARGLATDGSDRLRNIEVLQFADGTINTAIIASDTIPPGPVFGLAAVAGNTQVALSWINPIDASVIRVLRSTTGFTTVPVGTLQQTVVFDTLGTTFTDTGLVNGTTYFYSVFARDAAGNYSAVTTVSATPGVDQAPAVAITSPASGTVLLPNRTADFNVSATDDQGISHVELYLDGVLLTIDTTAPYGTRWPVTSGRHTLTAIAEDTGGQRTTATMQVCAAAGGFCVPLPPGDAPPTGVITFPTNGAVIPVNTIVDIQATASDDRDVPTVEFYVNGVLRRRDGSPRYHAVWQPTIAGRYQITAVFIDRSGQRTWDTIDVEVR